MSQTFDYIRHWDQDISIERVPARIFQRYAENLAHLVKTVLSYRELLEGGTISSSQESEVDIYGFRKPLVALTNYGKIFGLSSYDGKLLWSSDYFPSTAGTPQKILIRQSYSREDEFMQTQIVSVFSDSLKFLSPDTGKVVLSQTLKGPADQFMLVNLK